MIYTFRPWHILILIVVSPLLWAVFTGWECGFMGLCGGINSSLSIQGGIRLFTAICLVTYLITMCIISEYERKIKIPLPNIFTKFGPDDPDWKEFQEWKKENKWK